MNSKQLAEVTFSYSQPIPWRIIDAGLCLEGRCLAKNGRCNAYKQMVIGNLGLGQFTISRMYIFECPQCKGRVRAEKFGLNRCQWRIMNTYKWSIVNDIYRTYDLSRFPIHLEVHQLEKDYDSIEHCTICLAAMDKRNKCSILPCKHVFHMDCIHHWIDADEETSFQCPICRQPIFE
jgi:hypothetical protein